MLGDFLAVSEAVFDVQSDGVFDVLNGLFVCVSLAVTALKHGTGNEIAVRIGFDNDGEREVLHSWIIGLSPLVPTAFAEVRNSVCVFGISDELQACAPPGLDAKTFGMVIA